MNSKRNIPTPNKAIVVSRRSPREILLVVLVVTFVAFFPSLRNGFTNWDDDTHILKYRPVQALNGANLQEMFTSTVHDTYIPLTTLSFAVEHHFFGFNPYVFHLDNLLLHLLVTGLAFLVGMRLGLAPLTAGLAALIFSIHPLRVESVAWVTERKDVLYGVFYLGSLYLYLRYCDEKKWGFYVAAVLAGLPAILAKPMALSLPLIFLLCDWFRKRRFDAKIFAEKIPFLLYLIPITWITYSLHVRMPVQDMGQAALIWVWTSAFYWQKFLFPLTLVPIYNLSKPVALGNPAYLGALVTVFLVILWLVLERKRRWSLFAFLFFFGSIFFLLRLDETMDVNIVADRFMYLPSLGLSCYVAVMAVDFYDKAIVPRRLMIGMVVMGLGILAGKTFWQCQIWRNDETLWTYVIEKNPNATVAYNNRGEYYLQRRLDDKAWEDFNQAIAVNANNFEAYNNRGLVNLNRGRYDEAVADFNQAMRRNTRGLKSYYNNRGIAYQKMENYDAALADYSQAVAIDPRYADAYINRANVYNIVARYDAAFQDYQKALSLEPQNFYAHYGIGIVYLMQQNNNAAMAELNHTLQINPQYGNAYFYRAKVYENMQAYAPALQDAVKAREFGFEEEGYIEKLRRAHSAQTGG